jgi:hypothetical protein
MGCAGRTEWVPRGGVHVPGTGWGCMELEQHLVITTAKLKPLASDLQASRCASCPVQAYSTHRAPIARQLPALPALTALLRNFNFLGHPDIPRIRLQAAYRPLSTPSAALCRPQVCSSSRLNPRSGCVHPFVFLATPRSSRHANLDAGENVDCRISGSLLTVLDIINAEGFAELAFELLTAPCCCPPRSLYSVDRGIIAVGHNRSLGKSTSRPSPSQHFAGASR